MEIIGHTIRWPYIGSLYTGSPIVWQEVMRHDDGKCDVRGYLAMKPDGSVGDELMDEGEATRVAHENLKTYLSSLRHN